MELEVWKPIPEIDNYQASSLGRIRSLDRVITNSLGVSKKRKGQILIGGENHGEYRQVNHCVNGKQKSVSVHRWIAKAFHPNPDNLEEVHHKDGNRRNNREDNLEWISSEDHRKLENSKDYIFLSPTNEIVNIHNLADFCRTSNLHAGHMYSVHNGKRFSHKGWTKPENK